jgi:O-antigen/teichoic acid export membrane protein
MNYVSQAAGGIAALVVTPLLLHHLGQSAFGLWVLASSVVGYFELFEFGFGAATVKMIAEDAYVRPSRAVRTLNTSLAVLVPFGIFAFGLALVVALNAPSIFTVPAALHNETVLLFVLLALGLAVSIPGDAFGGALQGLLRWDLLSAANSLQIFLTAGVSAAVVLAHGGLVALAAYTTAVSISFHGVRWAMLRRILPEARLRPGLVDRSRLGVMARMSGWFVVSDVANTVTSTSDLVVVGVIFGVRPAAIYAIGYKLAQIATNARGAFTAMLFPHAAATARNEGPEALHAVATDGTRLGLLASLAPTLVLVILASSGVRAWVGPGYEQSARVLMVLVAAFFVGSLATPMTNILYGAGKVRTMSLIASANAICNLGLSILLAHLIGPVGVAVGTLGGALFVWLPGVLIMGRRALGVTPYQLLRTSVAPNILPAAAAAAVLFALRPAVAGSIGGLVLTAGAAVAVYLAGYLLVGATPYERGRVRNLARRVLPARQR